MSNLRQAGGCSRLMMPRRNQLDPRHAFIDPRTVMRIKNLQLRARVVVEGFYTGIHRSPYHGFSVEFSEYRAYTPGDDPRYLDWRLFARSDRYYIKRFEDETNLRCYLVVDMSRSMSFGSAEYTKSEYARTLAASLAYFLFTQRDAVGLLTFDEEVADYLPPRHRAGHLRRLYGMLDRETAGRATDLSRPLERIAESVRKRGLVVLDLRSADARRRVSHAPRLPPLPRARRPRPPGARPGRGRFHVRRAAHVQRPRIGPATVHRPARPPAPTTSAASTSTPPN